MYSSFMPFENKTLAYNYVNYYCVYDFDMERKKEVIKKHFIESLDL